MPAGDVSKLAKDSHIKVGMWLLCELRPVWDKLYCDIEQSSSKMLGMKLAVLIYPKPIFQTWRLQGHFVVFHRLSCRSNTRRSRGTK